MSEEQNNQTQQSYDKLLETLSKSDIKFEDLAERLRSEGSSDMYNLVKKEFYTNREQTEGQITARQFAQFLSGKLIHGDDENLDATFSTAFGLYKQLYNDRDKVLAFDELHKLVKDAGGTFDLNEHKLHFMKNFDSTRFDVEQSRDVATLMSGFYRWADRSNNDDQDNRLGGRLGKAFTAMADDMKAFIDHNNGQVDYKAPVMKRDEKAIQAIKDANEYPLTEAHNRLFEKMGHIDIDFQQLAKQTDIILLDNKLTETQKSRRIADVVSSAYYTNPMKTEGQRKAKQVADELSDSLRTGNDKETAMGRFIDTYRELDVTRDRNLAINQLLDNLKANNASGSLKTDDRQKLVAALNDINGDKRGLDYVSGSYKSAIKNYFSGIVMENFASLKEANKQSETLEAVITPVQQDGKITFTLDTGMLERMKKDGKIVVQLSDIQGQGLGGV